LRESDCADAAGKLVTLLAGLVVDFVVAALKQDDSFPINGIIWSRRARDPYAATEAIVSLTSESFREAVCDAADRRNPRAAALRTDKARLNEAFLGAAEGLELSTFCMAKARIDGGSR
jgi:hypothetical protein